MQSAINVNDANAIIVLSIASKFLSLHSLIIFIFFNVIDLRSISFLFYTLHFLQKNKRDATAKPVYKTGFISKTANMVHETTNIPNPA